MAGPRVLDAPSALAERQRARVSQGISRHHAIDASVTMLGNRFTTTIREGASAEELIEKVARENGGGVAKVYYPEFKTWEIVAVKIGDMLLVKGDAKKVADADFSGFADAAAVRRQAIAAASRSDGGIHFSLGQSGIPMAMTEGQGIVFPNAEELRVSRETSSIALWMTAANVNPVELKDLERAYSAAGGLRISEGAQKLIISAHEGVRSEKLMLHDNLLVLDKESGEIRTASEYADRIRVEGFAAPQFQVPAYTSVGLAMPSEQGVIAAPMDASPFRIPYLFVKVFDGRLVDHVSVQFNLIRECVQPAIRRDAGHVPQDAPQSTFRAPSNRVPSGQGQSSEAGHPESESAEWQLPSAPSAARATIAPSGYRSAQFRAPHAPNFPQHLPPSMKIAPETIMTSWLGTRLPPLRFVVPNAVRPIPPRREPKSVARPPIQPKIQARKAGAKRLSAGPSPDSAHGAKKKKRKPKREQPLPPEGQKRAAPKPKAAIPNPPLKASLKKRKRETAGHAETPGAKAAEKGARSRSLKTSPRAAEAPPHWAKAPGREQKTGRKKARLPAYFWLGMLGLLPQWKTRGRKFRTKKSSAV